MSLIECGMAGKDGQTHKKRKKEKGEDGRGKKGQNQFESKGKCKMQRKCGRRRMPRLRCGWDARLKVQVKQDVQRRGRRM